MRADDEKVDNMKRELASQLKRFMIVMRSTVKLLYTVIRICEHFSIMFFEGGKLRDIKSRCLVVYGNYLHREKEIDKAITCYLKAVNLNPNNFYAYGGLTWAYIEKHMFQEAQEYCTKAIKIKELKGILSPQTVRIKLLQIIIYESLGQITLANETIDQIQTFFNNNLAAIHDRLERTYFNIGMFRQAEDHGKKAKMARIEFQKVVQLESDKRWKDYTIKNIENIEKKMRTKD